MTVNMSRVREALYAFQAALSDEKLKTIEYRYDLPAPSMYSCYTNYFNGVATLLGIRLLRSHHILQFPPVMFTFESGEVTRFTNRTKPTVKRSQ